MRSYFLKHRKPTKNKFNKKSPLTRHAFFNSTEQPNKLINSVIHSSSVTLPYETRQFFEPRFNYSFNNVKIHTGNNAAKSAENLNAEAYSYNDHIVFNEGNYKPGTKEGNKLLAHELSHVAQSSSKPSVIQRKMKVPSHDKPAFNCFDQQTSQSDIILKYFNQLCADANVSIVKGDVILPPDFCTKEEPDAGEPNPLSRAELSQTPTSCTCLCDLDASSKEVTIQVDDKKAGLTAFTHDPGEEALDAPRGAMVTVPSPLGKTTTQMMKSGNKETFEPFIVFGHELCGHAWMAIKGELMKDENAERGRGGHQEVIRRENMMRREHGLTERNTFREPFCGEVEDSKFQKECKIWRDEYNKLNATKFTLADTIPENTTEEKPADFTFDIFFNKDMPQSWFDPAASFNVSVTSTGKTQFEEAINMMINFHPNKSFQLEGHASIEKPANDPTYNDRLSKRRVELILKELAKKGVDSARLGDKADSGCVSFEAGLKNCSDSESSKDVEAMDRRVVIRVF